jgi:hypothetical protein
MELIRLRYPVLSGNRPDRPHCLYLPANFPAFQGRHCLQFTPAEDNPQVVTIPGYVITPYQLQRLFCLHGLIWGQTKEKPLPLWKSTFGWFADYLMMLCQLRQFLFPARANIRPRAEGKRRLRYYWLQRVDLWVRINVSKEHNASIFRHLLVHTASQATRPQSTNAWYLKQQTKCQYFKQCHLYVTS